MNVIRKRERTFDTAVSMIPSVDHVCDVRDIIASCKQINNDSSDALAWMELVLCLIGLPYRRLPAEGRAEDLLPLRPPLRPQSRRPRRGRSDGLGHHLPAPSRGDEVLEVDQVGSPVPRTIVPITGPLPHTDSGDAPSDRPPLRPSLAARDAPQAARPALNCSSSVEPLRAVVEDWPCWIAWVTASK